MESRLAGLGVVLVIAAGFSLAPAPIAAEQGVAGVPNLSGRWRLNKQLSDDEAAKLAGSGGTADKQTPARAEGTHEATAPPAADRPAAADSDPRGGEGKAAPMEDITVTQSAVEVAVADKAGHTRSFYPNGRTYKADEGASTVKTAWKDGALVFEKKNARGWKLTETVRLTPDGAQLRYDSRFEGGGRPTVVIKRVYDRIPEGK